MISTTSRSTAPGQHDAVRKQIRGSGLLLAGRILSTGIVFLAQVLIVRQLSTADYGAFAYALAIVNACQAFSTLGLHKSISRFVPIYQEQRDKDRIAGTIALSIGVIGVTLLLIGVLLLALPDRVLHSLDHGQQAVTIISILIFLVPIEAFNEVLISLFASFGRPREIFFRSHVVGPVLRLTAVLALMVLHAGAVFLAIGYLVASLLGVLLYTVVLARYIAERGLFEGVRLSTIKVPAREMFSFAVPILTSEFVTGSMMSAVAVLLLGHYHGLTQVAIYRVAVPAARVNLTVMASFSLLYTPLAARLFAKADYEGLNQLYWRTTAWITVLTFPIFVVTFSLSKPLTDLLYGSRYDASANILALLSLGSYFNVALGFNTLTLRVFGKLRSIIVVNITGAIANLVLSFALIPRYGAMGAAVATTLSMILLNVITQFALRTAPGFRMLNMQYAPVYLFVTGGSLGLLALQAFASPNRYIAAALAVVICAAVFAFCKGHLRLVESFPELMRIPVLRAIFA
ncbi:MAG TPA: flippase [Clostridia bacterium]|nr:flippase [Clostridia bacterium]